MLNTKYQTAVIFKIRTDSSHYKGNQYSDPVLFGDISVVTLVLMKETNAVPMHL